MESNLQSQSEKLDSLRQENTALARQVEQFKKEAREHVQARQNLQEEIDLKN